MWMWLRSETTIYLLMLENRHSYRDEFVARLLKNSGWKWSSQQPQQHAIPLILMVFYWWATVTTHMFLSVLLDGILLESCTQRPACPAVSRDDSTSLLLLRSGFLQQHCILHATIYSWTGSDCYLKKKRKKAQRLQAERPWVVQGERLHFMHSLDDRKNNNKTNALTLHGLLLL